MRNFITIVEAAYGDAFDADDGDEESFDHLPSIKAVEALRPAIVAAAQKQYDEWQQDEEGYDEEVGHGGICHLIADDMASILGDAGFPVWTQTASDVQHVTCIVQTNEGIFDLDIPYSIYERGAMFTWTKLPDVRFEPADLSIYKMSNFPGDIEQYVENYD